MAKSTPGTAEVKVRIPSKASVVLIKAVSFICLVFGVIFITLSLFGFWATDRGVYEAAVAGHKVYAEAILFSINLAPLSLGVALYFLMLTFGFSKIIKQRELEIEIAEKLRASKRQ